MLKTINGKFIFFTVVFILFSIGIPMTFLIVQFRENFEQRSVIMLQSTQDVVYSSLINSMYVHQQNQVQNIVNNIARNQSVDHVRIFKSDGTITHASDSSEIGQNIFILSPEHINQNGLTSKNVKMLHEENRYSLTRPIQNEAYCQSCHGTDPIIAFIDVDTDLTQAERYFTTGSVHMIYLGIAILILLSIGFYLIFYYFINRPLLRFYSALHDVERGDLTTRLPAATNDEIGRLESHFNTMTQNLEAAQKEIETLHFEQLQRADKLVTLGELAAEMAHELNNPAGIIMSRADYLQMQTEENPSLTKYEEDLDVIINQIHKVSRITGSILKYGKKRPKKFSTLNLIPLIEESLTILDPRLQRKQIKTIKKFKIATAIITGDAQQIDQVITNIINNAIDAMEKGGTLTITLNKKPDNRIILDIADNGHGMDAQTVDQIFAPFFTTKPGERGTGLGLYIVKNILKNHDAQIECTSRPNEGAHFLITFKENKNT